MSDDNFWLKRQILDTWKNRSNEKLRTVMRQSGHERRERTVKELTEFDWQREPPFPPSCTNLIPPLFSAPVLASADSR